MFKCKNCGKAFGANLPAHCPDCGCEHDRTHRGTWLMLVMDNVVTVLFIAGLVAAGVIIAKWLG